MAFPFMFEPQFVEPFSNEFYPWAKNQTLGQGFQPQDQLGQPLPSLDQLFSGATDAWMKKLGNIGQPAPRPLPEQLPNPSFFLSGDVPKGPAPVDLDPNHFLPPDAPLSTGNTAPLDPGLVIPTGGGDLGQKLAPAAPGSFAAFDLKVSNRRPLPTDLDSFSLVLDATVNTAKVEHWCAINFQVEANLENYIIHFHFSNFDEPIHFTQKYQKHWTQNASVTEFTLKQASYDQSGTRKLRVVVNWSKAEQTYIFSFLGEDGQWLTHKFAPGYPIKYLYYNGYKGTEAPLLNDLRVTPLPPLPT